MKSFIILRHEVFDIFVKSTIYWDNPRKMKKYCINKTNLKIDDKYDNKVNAFLVAAGTEFRFL